MENEHSMVVEIPGCITHTITVNDFKDSDVYAAYKFQREEAAEEIAWLSARAQKLEAELKRRNGKWETLVSYAAIIHYVISLCVLIGLLRGCCTFA